MKILIAQKKLESISFGHKKLIKFKNTSNFDLNVKTTHPDILRDLYSEITSLFEQLDATAPSLYDLYPTDKWCYCPTLSSKDRGKVGYRCEFGTYGDKPFVKIVIHSFKHGGETLVFNSFQHSSYHRSISPRRQIPLAVLQQHQKDRQKTLQDQEQKKQAVYQDLLHQWERGSSDVSQHPYVFNKQIQCTEPLRSVGKAVAYRIYTIHHAVCGIQLIYPNGEKRIHGKKNGGFGILGHLESAKVLYLCEGYATANAVFQLVAQTTSKPFAVLICLDCHNVVLVAKLFNQKMHSSRPLVICPDNDLATFQKCQGNPGLLSGYEAAMLTGAKMHIPDPSFGSDWCDAWLKDPDAALAFFRTQHKIKKPTLSELALLRLQQFKQAANGHNLIKAVFQAFNLIKKNYLLKQSQSELLDQVYRAVAHTALAQDDIKAIWRKVKKRYFSQALRTKTFSQSFGTPLLSDLSFPGPSLESDATSQPRQSEGERKRSDSEVFAIRKTIKRHSFAELKDIEIQLRAEHPKAIFITNAPMGCGKTKELMQPNFIQDEAMGFLPIVITPSRALTKGVSERFDAAHYQEDDLSFQSSDSLPSSLAITINSLIKSAYQSYFSYSRSLYIDEYTQVLRAITMGTVQSDQRQSTEKQLARLIRKVDYLYIADADFNQIALDHLLSLLPNDRPVFILSLEKIPLKVTYKIHHYASSRVASMALPDQILSALRQGEKVYVATDSKLQVDKIKSLLEAENLSILAITSDTLHFKSSQAFLQDPDGYLAFSKPDVVIVSPAVQSGISIESDYFDRVFGLYMGTVVPVVFQQMLHRVRKQTVFDLILPKERSHPPQELENPTAILAAAYQQHIAQFGAENAWFDANTGLTHTGKIVLSEKNGALVISGDEEYARYEKLCADLTALDNAQRHHAAQYFVLQAENRGITIEVMHHEMSLADRTGLLEKQKQLMGVLKENRYHALCGPDNLSPDAYQTLKNIGVSTPEGLIEVERHQIARQLHLKTVTEEDIVFFDQNGAMSVHNYELLLKGEAHAHVVDERDKTKGVAKTNAHWQQYKIRLLCQIFDLLGLDPLSGQGKYTEAQARTARKAFLADEVLSRFILFKLKLKSDSVLSDVAFINKLIKKMLGLKLIRMQVRIGKNRHWVYRLDPIHFSRLKKYADLSRGQSIFEKNFIVS